MLCDASSDAAMLAANAACRFSAGGDMGKGELGNGDCGSSVSAVIAVLTQCGNPSRLQPRWRAKACDFTRSEGGQKWAGGRLERE